MIIDYDPSRPRFPDVNEYHPVTDWDKLVAALGPIKLLGFKVGNGDLNDPESDPTWDNHLKGAEQRGLIALGYWWGPTKVDKYLSMFPPKDGRIACLDFEGIHQNADLAHDFVVKLHSEWGRWPWFYGGASWRAHGKIGTAVENCPYWGPNYNGELITPPGVGKPFVHQYAASGRGPTPHSFDGVSPNCDMNSLLVPWAEVEKSANIGGDDMALNKVTDMPVLREMLFEVFGTNSEKFWELMLIGIGDSIRGEPKRDIPDPYGLGFDWAEKVAAGGGSIPAGTEFTAVTK